MSRKLKKDLHALGSEQTTIGTVDLYQNQPEKVVKVKLIRGLVLSDVLVTEMMDAVSRSRARSLKRRCRRKPKKLAPS